MIPDIFSAFDPHNLLSFQNIPNWFWVTVFTLALFPTIHRLWANPTINIIGKTVLLNLTSGILNSTKASAIHPTALYMTALFALLLLANLLGIIPSLFSLSSQIIITASASIPLWFASFISCVIHTPINSAAHLLPSGAPPWLSPPLVLIESISLLVRPLTLGIRLAANISAGHIVLTLASISSSSTIFAANLSSLGAFFIQAAYVAFELGICLIQAFIFFLLLSLYINDHNAPSNINPIN